MATMQGVIHGKTIELEKEPGLPEGQRVDVEVRPVDNPAAVAKERQEALRQLIGICKTEHPPDDEEVDRILEQERMKKYG